MCYGILSQFNLVTNAPIIEGGLNAVLYIHVKVRKYMHVRVYIYIYIYIKIKLKNLNKKKKVKIEVLKICILGISFVGKIKP